MSQNKLLSTLKTALHSCNGIWVNDDKTELAFNLLLDKLEKHDVETMAALLSNLDLKRHFFTEVAGALVFKKADFQFFLSQNKISHSYTRYKNRIGLTDGSRFLKDSTDIVLDFPFKDCVLNGGQSSEEGNEIYFERNKDTELSSTQLYKKQTRKRQEIFFNQVLAFDEIDRLLDPKALSCFSRHTQNGVQPVGTLKRHADGTLAENLIIKGNNLVALHTLKTQFKGKVKLIYIDPPYNTENDSFKYNDKFTHSTWLTFMKNRLEVAKTLLKDDGLIFIQCDDNEQPYLSVLANDIFGKENNVNTIIWRKVKSGKKQSKFLSNVTEYILVYSITNKIRVNKLFLEQNKESDYKNYPYIEENTNRRYGSFDFTQKGQGSAKYFNGVLLEPPKGKHWIWEQENIDEGIKNGIIIFTKNGTPRVKRYLDEKEGNPLSDLWVDDEVKIISANDSQRISEFDGQKPEALIQRIIELATNENDIILDYHLGSGTTAAVAHKMGRQYIGIEQMDYIETLAVERLKKVIDGEQSGISKAVNWQGGSEFVYFELAAFNEKAKDLILACEDFDSLRTLFNELCSRYFLKYTLSIKEFDDIMQEVEFQALSLDEQKQMMLEMLDLNQLYVNLSDMEDSQFDDVLSDEDKDLTQQFYGEQ